MWRRGVPRSMKGSPYHLRMLPTLSVIKQTTCLSDDCFFAFHTATHHAASSSRCPSLYSVRVLVHGLLFSAEEMRCSWTYVADTVAAAALVGSRMLNRSGSRIHKLFHQRSWQVRSLFIVFELHCLFFTIPCPCSAICHSPCCLPLSLHFDCDFRGSLLLAEGIRGP